MSKVYTKFGGAGKRMVTKQCPECGQQVPVACKSCPCGHDFFAKRKAMAIADEAAHGRRRTERVRRERQSYLTTLLLEERARAAKRKHRLRQQQQHPQRGRPRMSSSQDDSSEEGKKSNRGRPRKKLIEDIKKKSGSGSLPIPHLSSVKVEEIKTEPPPMPDEDDGDMFEDMSPEQLEQFAFVLEEINRKLMSQLFQQRFLT